MSLDPDLLKRVAAILDRPKREPVCPSCGRRPVVKSKETKLTGWCKDCSQQYRLSQEIATTSAAIAPEEDPETNPEKANATGGEPVALNQSSGGASRVSFYY